MKQPVHEEWANELPTECPPKDACYPNQLVVYRLVTTMPPTENDFIPQWDLHPEKKHRNECVAKSLSTNISLPLCQDMLKLTRFKNYHFIVCLVLCEDAGKTLQTGQTATHYSWWRYKSYDPISHCVPVDQ